MSPLELGKAPMLPEKPTWPAPPLAQRPAPARLPVAGTGRAAPPQTGPAPSQPPRHPAIDPLTRPDTEAVSSRLQFLFGNRFQVVGPLAIGGMAMVFKLRHRLHDGLFVAKVLHPELAEKPGIIQSFRMEATHAACLGNHPSAIPVFDFGELDGLFFLMMPFIEGEDLDCILQRTRERGEKMHRDEVLHLAAQISSLLSFAESQGIVHGDITPGNLRLDTFGRYRLLDFGLSESIAKPDAEAENASGEPASNLSVSPLRHSRLQPSPPAQDVSQVPAGPASQGLNRPRTQPRPFTAGTPLYASPEQIRGEVIDTRTDLYALGCVLAECLNGSPIFLADSLQDIRCRHLAGDWQLPTGLPATDPLASLLHRLLATRPQDRLESAYELSGILHALGFPRPEFRSTAPDRPRAARAANARRRLST